MYIPNHFKEENIGKLKEYIHRYSFGTLIISDDRGIEANHLPFCLHTPTGGSLGTLQCHIARKNSLWQRIGNGAPVLAIFQGPNAYISPSWYPSKAETGRVVPTWNYLAVHAHGHARTIQDEQWLKQHLNNLTDHNETGREQPWSVDDAPADYTSGLMRAIVGIEITIETLSGKLKASQNQTETNRAGVKAGLSGESDGNAIAMSKLVR